LPQHLKTCGHVIQQAGCMANSVGTFPTIKQLSDPTYL